MAGFKKPSMTRLPNTNKSCEGESIKEKQRKIDDLYGPGKSKTNLTMNIDFSESLKGLKAIQREARKATAALKELEKQKKRNISLPACRRCGSSNIEIEEVTADEKVVAVNKMCNDCGWG